MLLYLPVKIRLPSYSAEVLEGLQIHIQVKLQGLHMQKLL